jgi:hypothetical protein
MCSGLESGTLSASSPGQCTHAPTTAGSPQSPCPSHPCNCPPHGGPALRPALRGRGGVGPGRLRRPRDPGPLPTRQGTVLRRTVRWPSCSRRTGAVLPWLPPRHRSSLLWWLPVGHKAPPRLPAITPTALCVKSRCCRPNTPGHHHAGTSRRGRLLAAERESRRPAGRHRPWRLGPSPSSGACRPASPSTRSRGL